MGAAGVRCLWVNAIYTAAVEVFLLLAAPGREPDVDAAEEKGPLLIVNGQVYLQCHKRCVWTSGETFGVKTTTKYCGFFAASDKFIHVSNPRRLCAQNVNFRPFYRLHLKRHGALITYTLFRN